MGRATGFAVGRVAGVAINVDLSVAVIFALILFGLAMGTFPSWHPDWPAATSWAVAIVAAMLFFVSVLLHELSHAIVGRWQGISVNRITLFIFGGMAHMESEPPSPRAEFLMAIVGPLASLAIGASAIAVGAWSAGELPDDPELAARALSPVATLFLWLGPINVFLGLFNLVPGFPLDGGRVLRSIVWAITKDLRRATRWATNAGRGFAWILLGTGAFMSLGGTVPFFGTGMVAGLWLVLIGWFLNNAARTSYDQVVAEETLSGVPVIDVMRTQIESALPDMTVNEFVREAVINSDQRSFPVMKEGELVGLVCLDDVRQIGADEWNQRLVREIMTPVENLATIDVQSDAARALHELATRNVDQIPVMDHGHLRGFVRRHDIIVWLGLHRRAPA